MSKYNVPTFKLNDGNEIPVIGFGTFQIPADGTTYNAVKDALAAGHRHIDTVAAYMNEQEVGKAIKDSGFLETKSGLLARCGFKITSMKTLKRPLKLPLTS